jgi:2-iminobutanoate/2-iminopropanoate deaminase
MLKKVSTLKAAAPGGHYSQAIAHNNILYVSGQLPVNVDGTHTFDTPFEEQATLAIKNLLEIIKAGGSTPEKIIKVTVYLVGIENWPSFNKIYSKIMAEHIPARAIVPVPELHYGYLIEIEAIAAI